MSDDIKSMKLYVGVERIYNELAELGYGRDAPLDVEKLFPFDQYHYFGTDAVDEGIRRAGIEGDCRVLDVGSGLGGPARYIAHRVGCHVTAVEIQPDVHRTAADLTRRSGLATKVEHVCGDFLAGGDFHGFDVVVSWLAFLHIPDRPRLLERCLAALQPGGRLFVEDFHEVGRFTDAERVQLAEDVYCEYLPSLETFRRQCLEAGFERVEAEDATPAAIEFAAERARAFAQSRERQLRVHGEDITRGLQHFYDVIRDLFAGGHFGLGRVLATKAR